MCEGPYLTGGSPLELWEQLHILRVSGKAIEPRLRGEWWHRLQVADGMKGLKRDGGTSGHQSSEAQTHGCH